MAAAAAAVSAVQRALWMREQTTSAPASIAAGSSAWLFVQSHSSKVFANRPSRVPGPPPAGASRPTRRPGTRGGRRAGSHPARGPAPA